MTCFAQKTYYFQLKLILSNLWFYNNHNDECSAISKIYGNTFDLVEVLCIQLLSCFSLLHKWRSFQFASYSLPSLVVKKEPFQHWWMIINWFWSFQIPIKNAKRIKIQLLRLSLLKTCRVLAPRHYL